MAAALDGLDLQLFALHLAHQLFELHHRERPLAVLVVRRSTRWRVGFCSPSVSFADWKSASLAETAAVLLRTSPVGVG